MRHALIFVWFVFQHNSLINIAVLKTKSINEAVTTRYIRHYCFFYYSYGKRNKNLQPNLLIPLVDPISTKTMRRIMVFKSWRLIKSSCLWLFVSYDFLAPKSDQKLSHSEGFYLQQFQQARVSWHWAVKRCPFDWFKYCVT